MWVVLERYAASPARGSTSADSPQGFVLRNLLGHSTARNYDGAYLEWAGEPELPVHHPQTAA